MCREQGTRVPRIVVVLDVGGVCTEYAESGVRHWHWREGALLLLKHLLHTLGRENVGVCVISRVNAVTSKRLYEVFEAFYSVARNIEDDSSSLEWFLGAGVCDAYEELQSRAA